jgi:hypothetical protein
VKTAPVLPFALCAAFLLALCITGANAREARLPVPPVPPAHPPSIDAPVPNLNVPVPYIEAARTNMTLDEGINRRATPTMGEAYGPGARYKMDSDRRLFSLPGVMLRMPFP